METHRESAPHPGAGRWPALLLTALVLAHLVWLLFHFAPAYQSPDAHGYFLQARLIATEGRTGFVPESVVQYVGIHWLETESGVLHSRYPAGFPLLLAAAYKFGGPAGALLVNPLLASAALLLVFGLARRHAGDWGGLLAAAVVGTTAIVNQHALNADSHVAALFFLVAGVWALVAFADRPDAWWRGLAAGLLLGALPAVRYPEAVAGVAVAVFLFGRVRPVWRTWPAVLGAALPMGVLLLHNGAAYGAFWKTGYALTNEQTGFSWAYLAAHAFNYLRELGGQAGLLFFGLGVAGLTALAANRRWRAEGWLFAGIVLPVLALYMAYYWGGGGGPGVGAGGGGGLRFLIPLVPFFALGGAFLLFKVVALERSARIAVVGIVALIQLATGLNGTATMLAQQRAGTAGVATARRELEKLTPPDSVLIADQRLADSLDYTGRWRLVDAGVINGNSGPGGPGGLPGRRMARGGQFGPRAQPGFMPMRPDGAVVGPPGGGDAAAANRPNPMQQGKGKARRERYAGLTPEQRVGAAWDDVRAWAGARPVFWIGRNEEAMGEMLPDGAALEKIGEVDLPLMARPGAPGGAPNMMAGPGGAMRPPLGGGGMPGGPAFGPAGGRGFPPGAMGGRPFGPGLRAGPLESADTPAKMVVVRVKFVDARGQ